MYSAVTNGFINFPPGPYKRPEPETPSDSVQIAHPPGHQNLQGQQGPASPSPIGLINASPENIAFDRALSDISPREGPRNVSMAPGVMNRETFMAKLEPIPYAPGWFGVSTSKIINIAGRPIAVVRIGKVRVPFYASSGHSPKEGVTPGQWYPLLGISPRDGWFNKTSEMHNYYRSPKLLEAAKNLDRFVGDVRGDSKTAPPVPSDSEHLAREFINRDMDPVNLSALDVESAKRHIERAAALIEKGEVPRSGQLRYENQIFPGEMF